MNTKLKPIPELDALPDEKQEQLHKWIEDLGYHKAMAKLQEDWGISITYNKIYRYFQRVLQKRQYEEHLDHQIAMPEYLALLNGEPVPYSEAGIQTIHKRAFELAC